jgi:hypothetical protein
MEKIHTAIEKALKWIENNLNDFHPFSGNRVWDVTYGQRVSELAVLIYSLQDYPVFKEHYLSTLTDFLKSISQMDRFRDRVHRCPAEFVLYCDLYGILDKIGISDKEQKHSLKKVTSLNILDAVERTPHRIMDVALSLELAGLGKKWHRVNESYQHTILSKDINPVFVYEDGAYAITHVILFACCFGKRKFRLKSAKEYSRIFNLFTLLLLEFIFQEHWDLASEFVICWNSLGFPHTAVYDLCFQKLLDQQNGEGAFPGPEYNILYRKNKLKTQVEEETARNSFQHCYHTTLTTTIALVLHTNSTGGRVQSRSSLKNPGNYYDQERIIQALSSARKYFLARLNHIKESKSYDLLSLLFATLGYLCTSSDKQNELLVRILSKIKTQPASGLQQTNPFEDDIDYLCLGGFYFASINQPCQYFDEFAWRLVKGEEKHVLQHFPVSYTVARSIGLVNYEIESRQSLPDQLRANTSWSHATRDYSYGAYFTALSNGVESAGDLKILEGFAVHCIKRYQWKDACRTLHVLINNRCTPEYLMKYLLSQQKPDGSFGYWGPEFSVANAGLTPEQKDYLILARTFDFSLVMLNWKTGGGIKNQIFSWLGIAS